MKAKFLGGSLDGTESDRDILGHRYIVPTRIDGRHHRETYVRVGHDATHLHYRFESVEDVHEKTIEAQNKFHADTMRRVLGDDQ
jgi:hypothetical protein